MPPGAIITRENAYTTGCCNNPVALAVCLCSVNKVPFSMCSQTQSLPGPKNAAALARLSPRPPFPLHFAAQPPNSGAHHLLGISGVAAGCKVAGKNRFADHASRYGSDIQRRRRVWPCADALAARLEVLRHLALRWGSSSIGQACTKDFAE